MAVGFLTTRVSEPTEDDWVKLWRVLQYLRGTIDLVLTLGADGITKANLGWMYHMGFIMIAKAILAEHVMGMGCLLSKCQNKS